ncbi:MAG: glycosyltransferase family 4 protein [Opitutaceae bacterium]|nr:glycosyltransferase family 4 protein [Opitutaceae bacterium]
MPRKRICLVCADPATFDAFLLPHAVRLSADHEVSVACHGRPRHAEKARATFHTVGIERAVSPLRDLRALLALRRLFRREHFDLVHSFTPKAGLLAMLAARLAGVPRRLHTFTGQVWATQSGLKRRGLKALDRLLARSATHVLADSASQARFLENEGVIAPGRIAVIGDGSICGVNFSRFKPDPAARAALRAELAIADEALVFLFVGRLNLDKGVLDLARAFAAMKTSRPACLVFVGPDEAGMQGQVRRELSARLAEVRFVAATPTPERFMSASDVLCLPSHREGFGSVIIEAAACGCPCVASRIYGITDAVEEGSGGLLHAPGDVAALRRCLEQLAADRELTARLGRDARARVEKLFPEQRITDGLAAYYHAL